MCELTQCQPRGDTGRKGGRHQGWDLERMTTEDGLSRMKIMMGITTWVRRNKQLGVEIKDKNWGGDKDNWGRKSREEPKEGNN